MKPRGSRLVRMAAILVVLCVVAALAALDQVSRWRSTGPDSVFWSPTRGRASVRGDERMAWSAEEGGRARPLPPIPALADDPRMARLRRAAESWRRSMAPRRKVVDQVCLVPDVPSVLEAIGAWDDRHFFPILIDEPGWTLPFLRAFRPARIVRYAALGGTRAASVARPAGPRPSADRLDEWIAADRAVSRSWSPPSRPGEELPPAGAPPRDLGETPPGLVLSAPDSPMLAGAVALAAGRFQALVRLEPSLWGLDDSSSSAGGGVRYGDVLTLAQAWEFARHLEAHVASITPRYDRLGDDCDFLTIAGDWPYRYDDRLEAGPARGIQALDDLIGRALAGEPGSQSLPGSRRRWAFTGRLLGDPAASVARAMGALFLSPDRSLLWDTYEPGSVRSDYTTAAAAHLLGRAGGGARPVFYAAGQAASLANWGRLMDPFNRFGLIWINSSGYPTDFSIAGGPGRPADVPGGCPSAVVMIHSFSAADPADPGTIAGRWLSQGAFVYFGSVNEPYLQAFRKPGLVADLAIRGVPLSAALRQGENEPLGRPWRLIFLGDPLYRIPLPGLEGSNPGSPTGGPGPAVQGPVAPIERLTPESWRGLAPDYRDWPAAEVEAEAEGPAADDGHPDDRRLRWCLDAAIAELAGGDPEAGARTGPPWRPALKEIRRDRIDPRLRPALDELMVDALSRAGEWDELQARLSRIPPPERRPRVRAALEAGAMFRLARAARDPDPERRRARVRELLDEVNRSAWPAGSAFPAQFAERSSAIGR